VAAHDSEGKVILMAWRILFQVLRCRRSISSSVLGVLSARGTVVAGAGDHRN
jgi:hypothetical protein